jgi:hypothetical protein
VPFQRKALFVVATLVAGLNAPADAQAQLREGRLLSAEANTFSRPGIGVLKSVDSGRTWVGIGPNISVRGQAPRPYSKRSAPKLGPEQLQWAPQMSGQARNRATAGDLLLHRWQR